MKWIGLVALLTATACISETEESAEMKGSETCDPAAFEFLIGQPYLGGATENWFAYVLALIFLVFRPQGLFGDKVIERV